MGQNNEEKVLELFFEYPEKEFTIREISKLARVPRATVHVILSRLKKAGLVSKDNKASSSMAFRTKKTNHFVEKIVSSGLVDELVNKLNPSCIILFGSIRKGDSVKESDIDIFVESSIKKEISLSRFEKRLKHKIQLFAEPNMNNLQPNLFNNVVNGIKLYGSFKIK